MKNMIIIDEQTLQFNLYIIANTANQELHLKFKFQIGEP